MDHIITARASKAEKFRNRYNKWRYYYSFMERLYEYTIPHDMRVLHIGCVDGFVLRSIKPSYAVGIDDEIYAPLFSVNQGSFSYSLDALEPQIFDYIIVSAGAFKDVGDMQDFFKKLSLFSQASTRIIIEYSFPRALPITAADMRHFCKLSGLEIITEKHELIFPVGIPLIADTLNYIVARAPLIKKLCLMRLFITRFIPSCKQEYSVSVIVPCKNEAGNVEGAIARMPAMGSSTEIILVDGHSHDGTVAVMQEMALRYPDKKVSWFIQSKKGKKNAVEEGFARAQGDILMILDGDITVIPEELPKFYEVLSTGKGECVNGSRLVYPMDSQAMKPLNWMVNWTFGFIISYLIGQRVKDTLCGTKVFFKKDLSMINASKDFFGDIDPFGDFDILCGAAYQNLKIVDIPVHYKRRTYGAPGIAFFKSGLLLLGMSWAVFKKLFLRR